MVTAILSITAIQDEASALVSRGSLCQNQPIDALSDFYPDREWTTIAKELELNHYLLRDRIGDLVGQKHWTWD